MTGFSAPQAAIDVEAIRENLGPEILQTVMVIVGAAVVWFVVRRLARRWARGVTERFEQADDHRARERGQRLHTLTNVIVALFTALIAVVALLTLLVIWGIPIAPILAAGSVVGIAVGFGAQGFIKDVIAGFLILFEDQYSIGDTVTVGGVTGTVEQIRLRTTVLRSLDGSISHVPNGAIQVATNLTPDFSRVIVDVSVAYGEDVDRVIEVVADEAAAFVADPEWEATFIEAPQVMGVNRLGDSAVVVRVLFTNTPEQRWVVKRAFLRRIKLRFDAEGIEIPFPHITVVRPQE